MVVENVGGDCGRVFRAAENLMRVRVKAPGLARRGMLYPATLGDAGPIPGDAATQAAGPLDDTSKVGDLAMMLSLVSSLILIFRK